MDWWDKSLSGTVAVGDAKRVEDHNKIVDAIMEVRAVIENVAASMDDPLMASTDRLGAVKMAKGVSDVVADADLASVIGSFSDLLSGLRTCGVLEPVIN